MPVQASSTGATFTVLSTTDAGNHLRVTSTQESAYIAGLVSLAVEIAEDITGRSLASKKYSYKLDRFPCGAFIYLPMPPLLTSTCISSITYIDTDGSTDTWGSTYYTVDAHSVPARLTPAYQETWPIALNVPNAVTITYDAGYASSSQVPFGLLHAVKFMVGHWWSNRQDVVTGGGFMTPVSIPKNSDWLLASYKVPFYEGY